MENLDPLPPPKSRMGKWCVFALCAASFLIWGDGGLLFHFILSKIVAISMGDNCNRICLHVVKPKCKKMTLSHVDSSQQITLAYLIPKTREITEVSPGNTALDNPTTCQCVFASPSESNINYIHTRFAWLTFSSCFIISDIISAVRQASFFKSRTAQWCTQLLNQFFFRKRFLWGYHPTLKLSGIPTFTLIVGLTYSMDNIQIIDIDHR